MKSNAKFSRGQVRYLLKLQKGRCAITGDKINPKEVSADHIIPIARTELKKDKNYGKVWLVGSHINRLKSNMTMDEFYALIEKILKNKKNTKKIFDEISKGLKELSKDEFDKYINDNYDENGIIKK